jgi:hypothetical protein
MPVEGQWRRVNAPLPARDKRVLALAAAAALLACVAALVVYLTRSTPSSNAGCVTTTVASTMGGAEQRICPHP